jgi:hypothetical protein
MSRAGITFECSLCAKVFSGKDELLVHMVEHHGRREQVARQQIRPRVHSIPPELSARGPEPAAVARVLFEARATRRSARFRVNARRLLLVAAAVLVVAFFAATANAWFISSASVPIQITAGKWVSNPMLTLTPGHARATHLADGGCPRDRAVATADARGNLSLDFGDLSPSWSAMTWNDVFRVTSKASLPVSLSFSVKGSIAPLVDSVTPQGERSGLLKPRKTMKVLVSMRVPKCTAPGKYTGTIELQASGAIGRVYPAGRNRPWEIA